MDWCGKAMHQFIPGILHQPCQMCYANIEWAAVYMQRQHFICLWKKKESHIWRHFITLSVQRIWAAVDTSGGLQVSFITITYPWSSKKIYQFRSQYSYHKSCTVNNLVPYKVDTTTVIHQARMKSDREWEIHHSIIKSSGETISSGG